MKTRFLLAVLCIGFVPPVLAQDTSAELDRQIANCRTYAACMRLLDNNERVARAHAPEFTAQLQQFGARAKRELLKRAIAKNFQPSRSVEAADAILRNWNGWTEADIPALRDVLRSNPESQVGWALVQMGTPRSVQVMVEDAAEYGASADPVAAVSEQALPLIVAQLSGNKWQPYRGLLFRIADKVVLPNDSWAAIAADTTKPESQRVVALRALASQRTMTTSVRQNLENLLLDSNPELQKEVLRAVLATHGTAPAQTLAHMCPLRENEFTSADAPFLEDEWRDCIKGFVDSGETARPFGDVIVARFLSSQNGADRSIGATAIGYTGYAPAIPRLTELLTDPDWRVVYASIRALGWLGAKQAIPAIETVATAHWLPDIREYANSVAATLRTAEGKLPRPAMWSRSSEQARYLMPSQFEITSSVLVEGVCESEKWQWQDIEIPPPVERRRNSLPRRFEGVDFGAEIVGTVAIGSQGPLEPGNLIGTNGGEWGGQALWKSRRGKPEVVYGDALTNITGIEASSRGAIAVFQECCGGGGALSVELAESTKLPPRDDNELSTILVGGSYGFAAHLSRGPSGKWQVHEAARLPQDAYGLSKIAPDLYAAWSAGHVIVFNPDRILGSASCVK